MKTLDLYKIWEVLNFITEQEEIIEEKEIYPYILGTTSIYYRMDFESFLNHYSFRVDEKEICIFNDDQVPYEDFTNSDYSFIPKEILELNYEDLILWFNKEVDEYKIKEEKNKIAEKQNLQSEIERLTKRLEKL